MHNRTKVIAAAVITAALAAGSTAAAVASTTGSKPSVPATTVSASGTCTTGADLAAQLGVSQARFDQAAVAVKTSLVKASLVKGSAKPTDAQFYALLAHDLGISQARVQQVFAAEKPCASKPGSKPGGPKQGDPAAERRLQAAFTAAVASELHLSTGRVAAALAPILAAGHADTTSPDFVAAARSLGVSPQQLMDALMHAKESLAAGKPGGPGGK
jgi:hypothetical protein